MLPNPNNIDGSRKGTSILRNDKYPDLMDGAKKDFRWWGHWLMDAYELAEPGERLISKQELFVQMLVLYRHVIWLTDYVDSKVDDFENQVSCNNISSMIEEELRNYMDDYPSPEDIPTEDWVRDVVREERTDFDPDDLDLVDRDTLEEKTRELAERIQALETIKKTEQLEIEYMKQNSFTNPIIRVGDKYFLVDSAEDKLHEVWKKETVTWLLQNPNTSHNS